MSDTSEVLARKYRPRRFDDLIGQNTIAQTLALALDSNRLSHAYLFSGLRGSGKTSTARIFAKSLVCEQGPTSHPCETCTHCVMANEYRHMDIIEMDAASSRKIDDIRDLIEHTKYRPASAKFKIFIIDEVHMLTKEAFNALLKTLEEPPAYVKFILATTDPLKLPATILSRTQHFRFKHIADTDIIHHLEHILNLEQIQFEPQALEILARSGNGSVRDTLTLLDQAIIYSKGFVDVNTVTEMLGLIDPQFIDKIFAAIFSKNSSQLIEYTKELIDYETDMVIDELIAFLKDKLFSHDSHYPLLLTERFFRILSEAKSLITINADGTFVLTLCFFKMMEALKLKDIEQLIKEMQPNVKQIPITQPQTEAASDASAPTSATQPVSRTAEPAAPQEPAAVVPPIDPAAELFGKLRAKVMDRNAQLGHCFNEGFSLISFDKPYLFLDICAEDVCKKELRTHYKDIILPFIMEIFGSDTKIEITTTEVEKKNPEPPTVTEEAYTVTHHDPVAETIPLPETPNSESEPNSHTQEAEEEPAYLSSKTPDLAPSTTENFEGGSCVTGCGPDESPQRSPELDRDAILHEPMVQKAIELFGNKVTIQNKI